MKKILALSVIILAFSCRKEESIPLPEASFDIAFNEVGIYDVVEFDNTSIYADKYEWSFGDGNIAIAQNPKHAFKEKGNYQIVLKAYNIAGAVSIDSVTINVQKRRIRSLWLDYSARSLPSNMFFFFGEVDNPDLSYFAVFPSNITQNDLPFGGKINFGEVVEFSDQDWFWTLVSNMPPLDSFGDEDKLVFGTTINPVRTESIRDGNDLGVIRIDQTKNIEGKITSDYAMEIGYLLQ